MKIYYGFDNLPRFRNAVVTVGSYDGVHCGHRRLLSLLIGQARRLEGESVVMTFAPHPRQVLGRGPVALLNSVEEKAMLLEEAGVDHLIVIPFDEEFSRISSEEFIGEYLVGKVGMKAAVVGYNHRFGHDRESGADVLGRLSGRYGFEVMKVERCQAGDRKVSSTEVRKAVESGEVEIAAELLSRPYMMVTDVEQGRAMWSEHDKLLPPDGRYEVLADGEPTVALIERGEMRVEGVRDGRTIVEFVARARRERDE